MSAWHRFSVERNLVPLGPIWDPPSYQSFPLIGQVLGKSRARIRIRIKVMVSFLVKVST